MTDQRIYECDQRVYEYENQFSLFGIDRLSHI